MQSIADQQTPVRPGYLVVQGVVTDRECFKAYAAALPPIYAKYGGRYLATVPAPSKKGAKVTELAPMQSP